MHVHGLDRGLPLKGGLKTLRDVAVSMRTNPNLQGAGQRDGMRAKGLEYPPKVLAKGWPKIPTPCFGCAL